MSKDLTPQERKAKELGYKFYKVLLHGLTIFCLWRIYLCVTDQLDFLVIYGLCFVVLILKHIEVAFIKKKAGEADMLETVWLENEREKKKNSKVDSDT